MTTQTTKDVAFVEQHLHPSDTVTIIERYEPCEDGESTHAMFGKWPNFIPMKLVSRRMEDGTEI